MEQRPDGTWEILHVDTGLPPATETVTLGSAHKEQQLLGDKEWLEQDSDEL